MNTIILGVASGLGGILVCYTIAFGIGAIIARADKREEQRFDYLADDPRISALFPPPHNGGDTR